VDIASVNLIFKIHFSKGVQNCDPRKPAYENVTVIEPLPTPMLQQNSTNSTKLVSNCDIPIYMEGMWIIFYWSIQILAWIVIPICQSYVSNGEFSFFRRFVRSLWENVRKTTFQNF
jgi:hypothetical protein